MSNHIVKGMTSGFIATAAMSVLMVMKSMMGVMPNMDAIQMLTGMAHSIMGTPETSIVGWLMHFMIGTLAWGTLFAMLFDRIPGKSAVAKGLVFGTGAWLMMMIAVMPMAGAGLFGLRLGIGAPMATLMLHWVFGAVLGALYGRRTENHPTLVHKHS